MIKMRDIMAAGSCIQAKRSRPVNMLSFGIQSKIEKYNREHLGMGSNFSEIKPSNYRQNSLLPRIFGVEFRNE